MLVSRPQPMFLMPALLHCLAAFGAGRWRSLSEASEGFPDGLQLSVLQ